MKNSTLVVVLLLALPLAYLLGRGGADGPQLQASGAAPAPEKTAYPPTVTMYDNKGAPREVREDSVWTRFLAGKLGFKSDQLLTLEDTDDGNRRVTFTGAEIAKIQQGDRRATYRYNFVGKPNPTMPQNLAPPDPLLP